LKEKYIIKLLEYRLISKSIYIYMHVHFIYMHVHFIYMHDFKVTQLQSLCWLTDGKKKKKKKKSWVILGLVQIALLLVIKASLGQLVWSINQSIFLFLFYFFSFFIFFSHIVLLNIDNFTRGTIFLVHTNFLQDRCFLSPMTIYVSLTISYENQ
jgi:hypothetical protein